MPDAPSLRPTHAAYLPPRAGTRHDPFVVRLDAAAGWRAAVDSPFGDGLVQRCGRLELAPAGTAPGDPDGSFGGRILPKTVAIAPNDDVFLLRDGALHILDPCTCKFMPVPFGVSGMSPVALAVSGAMLVIADPAARRVYRRHRRGFAAFSPLAPPAGAVNVPWQPVALAVLPGGVIAVGDPANGAVHRFASSGQWLGAETGLGAVSALALNKDGMLCIARAPGEPVLCLNLRTGQRETATPGQLPCDPRRIYRDGVLELSAFCDSAQDGVFRVDGDPLVTGPVGAVFVAEGVLLAGPIDSQIHDCQWDIARVAADTPEGGRLRIETFCSNVDQPAQLIATSVTPSWDTLLAMAPGQRGTVSAPVRSPRGRWIWLRITLSGPGHATPSIGRIDLHYPRRGLARFLPEVVLSDPRAADFTERFLGIFEQGQRSIEHQMDRKAALFDVDTAPSAPHADADWLGWLAGWIGVTLDRALPEATRRRLLRSARRDMGRTGTVGALQNQLLALIGLDPHDMPQPHRAACVPCKTPQSALRLAPMLVLEHFRLRRWLIAGLSRLDAASELWGQRILNQTILDKCGTELGKTELNTYQDPWRGPFHRDAHRFSVFLPARFQADPVLRRAARAVIEAHRPAHSAYAIHYVRPAMRLGQQARLGVDSVIARRTGDPIVLNTAHLGAAGVVEPGDGPTQPNPDRLGTTMRLKPDT